MELSLDALIRAIQVNKDSQYILFTGAGASISSGVPSANQCIWDWKRRIFLSKNPGLESQFSELSLEFVKSRIQSWIDGQGEYPPLGSQEEYSVFAERCFPIANDRKRYFETLANNAAPAIGYKILPYLVRGGFFSESWTTNFDGLVDRASLSSGKSVISVAHDSTDRLNREVSSNEFISVALHGDYRYDDIKNTDAEFKTIRDADEILRKSLASKLVQKNLVVIGYSGRDLTVMETLAAAYSRSGVGRLYWFSYEDEDIPSGVRHLIEVARKNGREAHLIRSHGFDDLLTRLSFACLPENLRVEVEELINKSTESLPPREIFDISAPNTATIIKGNLLEVVCPADILKIECQLPNNETKWGYLNKLREDINIAAGALGDSLYCFGEIDYVSKVFSEWKINEIKRVPIDDKDLRFADGVITGIINQAIVKGLAQRFELSCT